MGHMETVGIAAECRGGSGGYPPAENPGFSLILAENMGYENFDYTVLVRG